MRTVVKIITEIIAVFGFPYGLYQTHVLTSQTAITIALSGFVFILCFEELNNELNKQLNKRFNPINKILAQIQNAVAEVQKFLFEKLTFTPLHEIKPAGYVQEFSPLRNTPLGEGLLEQSGGKKIVDEHYLEYEAKINQNNQLTALDVQSISSFIIAEVRDEYYMKPVKDFVYNHPKLNGMPLELTDVQRVMVLYLRDKYLAEHPDIIPS